MCELYGKCEMGRKARYRNKDNYWKRTEMINIENRMGAEGSRWRNSKEYGDWGWKTTAKMTYRKIEMTGKFRELGNKTCTNEQEDELKLLTKLPCEFSTKSQWKNSVLNPAQW